MLSFPKYVLLTCFLEVEQVLANQISLDSEERGSSIKDVSTNAELPLTSHI
jgi:hypothetical protein